ncbi:COP23 domain-containing protein [Okeania sp. KiyG1]|uniref:COP23 domain-containing protein n=1 Tax=Okeania sp. KiyG1 TaxID=2720165 RepID=UPI001923D03B|nr:COP23 domain-containing protein [Okeania sp. KiyG1]GGA27116.1 hypothetical protein CYANOKiyG1_43320 [Okeania sp. KiyG1]
MKLKFFLKSALTGILGGLSFTVYPLAVRAENIKDTCTSDSPIIEISSHTDRPDLRDVLYFRFDLTFPNDLNRAQQTCEEVSEKLQTHLESDQKLEIILGKPNDRFVICLAQEDSCSANSKNLFALKPEEGPELLSNLLDVKPSKRSLAGDGLYLSTVGIQTNFWQRTLQRFTPRL